MKTLIHKQTSHQRYWVGNGFPVKTIFSYNDLAPHISPFLHFDHAGPYHFPPTEDKLGVGEHPHRGFETVTIVYSGEVEHRDSAGGGGIIHDNDVQWMTAASGLVHEEFHGKNFAKSGGPFEMAQLWVNLPAKYKMVQPRYQSILTDKIPHVQLSDAGYMRIISGEYENIKGPALTYSRIQLWDMRLRKDHHLHLNLTAGDTVAIYVLNGELETQDGQKIETHDVALFSPEGTHLELKINEDSKVLFLGGENLNEPIVGYGPFVMNTKEEIIKAFDDFKAGKMGSLQKIEGSD